MYVQTSNVTSWEPMFDRMNWEAEKGTSTSLSPCIRNNGSVMVDMLVRPCPIAIINSSIHPAFKPPCQMRGSSAYAFAYDTRAQNEERYIQAYVSAARIRQHAQTARAHQTNSKTKQPTACKRQPVQDTHCCMQSKSVCKVSNNWIHSGLLSFTRVHACKGSMI